MPICSILNDADDDDNGSAQSDYHVLFHLPSLSLFWLHSLLSLSLSFSNRFFTLHLYHFLIHLTAHVSNWQLVLLSPFHFGLLNIKPSTENRTSNFSEAEALWEWRSIERYAFAMEKCRWEMDTETTELKESVEEREKRWTTKAATEREKKRENEI